MLADPDFNSYEKRDWLPRAERLAVATSHLEQTYLGYAASKSLLTELLQEDMAL